MECALHPYTVQIHTKAQTVGSSDLTYGRRLSWMVCGETSVSPLIFIIQTHFNVCLQLSFDKAQS